MSPLRSFQETCHSVERRARQGQSCGLLIYGRPGVGKTTLVRKRFLENTEVFAGMGKAEQFGCAFPHRPVLDAVRQATSSWLSRATQDKVKALCRRLAGFEDIISLLVPELASWVGRHESMVLTPEQSQRFVLSIRRLLSGLCESEEPLVLIIDDLQWLDNGTIQRLILGLESSKLRGLILVLCTRDDSISIERARNILTSLSALGFATQEQDVTALHSGHTVKLISETTGKPEEMVADIARSVGLSANSSPLFLRHVVDFVCEGGDLTQVAGNGDIMRLLELRLSQFSTQERELLGLIACAGQVNQSVLAGAAEQLSGQSSLSHFLGRAESAGLITRSQDDPALISLSHDRLQEACAGDTSFWPARNLALLVASVSQGEATDSTCDSLLFWQIDRMLKAAPLLKTHPLRQRAISISMTASSRARQRAAVEIAMKACRMGQELLIESDPAGIKGEVLLEYATTCWLFGYPETFEILADQAAKYLDPLQLVPITGFQLQHQIASGNPVACIDTAYRASSLLLPNFASFVEDGGAYERASPDEVLTRLVLLRQLKSCSDPIIMAASDLLSTANAAAYVGAPERLGPLLALQLELNLRFGATRSLALTLAFWAARLTNRPETLEVAFEVGQLALALSSRCGDGLIEARVRDLTYGMVLCWHHDLRLVIGPLQSNKELATRHGTFEYAGYSLVKSIAYRVFSGDHLSSIERDIVSNLVEFENLGSNRLCLYLRRDLAAIRQLRHPDFDPCALTDSKFSLNEMREELVQSNDLYGLLYTATYRLILAIIYEDFETAVQLAKEASSLRRGGPGLAHQGILSWLSGTALLSRPKAPDDSETRQIETFLSQLDQWSLCAPTTWRARHLHLQAEVARVQGEIDLAYDLYEQAWQSAQESANLFDQVVISARRSVLDVKGRALWNERSRAALQTWREKEPSVWFTGGNKDGLLLDAAVQITRARSEVDMARAVLDLLREQLGARQVMLISRRGQVLTSWNADSDKGHALCESALRSGESFIECREGLASCCVPIVVGDEVQAALYAACPLSTDRPEGANILSAMQSTAELAYSAYQTLGLGIRLNHTESELLDKTAFFTTLVNESGAALFARDATGRTILANPAYAGYLGYPSEELIGKVLSDVLDPDIAGRLLRNDRIVMSCGTARESLEKLSGPNGETRIFATVRAPLRDGTGRVTGVCGAQTDITLIRQAEEEVQRSERLVQLGTFAGKIAHDLNNMVNAIRGNLDYLRLSVPDSSELLESVQDIELTADRARDLVAGILRFCRQPPPDLYPFLLKDLLEEVREVVSIKLNKAVSISLNLPSSSISLCADASQIYQVVLNLLTNAVQAMGNRGTVEITVEEISPGTLTGEVPGLSISVRDEGIGMEPDTATRAFDAFFTTKGYGEGSGLGLSIVKGIVQAHGGHIELKSHPGEGTTITVFLPNPPIS